MNVNEAIARQWLRDNKGNLAWTHLKLTDDRLAGRSNLDNIIGNGPKLTAGIIDSELGALTYEKYAKRKNPEDAEALGAERCASCHEMVADPVDSYDAGGHLCPGCMRWYRFYDQSDPDESLEWQCWKGRTALWCKIWDGLQAHLAHVKHIEVEYEA